MFLFGYHQHRVPNFFFQKYQWCLRVSAATQQWGRLGGESIALFLLFVGGGGGQCATSTRADGRPGRYAKSSRHLGGRGQQPLPAAKTSPPPPQVATSNVTPARRTPSSLLSVYQISVHKHKHARLQPVLVAKTQHIHCHTYLLSWLRAKDDVHVAAHNTLSAEHNVTPANCMYLYSVLDMKDDF